MPKLNKIKPDCHRCKYLYNDCGTKYCKKKTCHFKERECKKEYLSSDDFAKMMRHDSYSREHGAIKQKRWS